MCDDYIHRVWLLRYDYGVSLANKSQIWKKDLGVNHSTWWIEHQQTWGNELYLLKIVAIPYALSVGIAIMLSPVVPWMDEWTPVVTFVGAIAVILCIFIIINVWKVREIHDNFHIKDEVLLFAKFSIYCYNKPDKHCHCEFAMATGMAIVEGLNYNLFVFCIL